MAISLKSTSNYSSHGLKALVYGQAGVGKTTLIRTLPKPVILSAESGLLSLQNENLPYIEIKNMDTLNEAYEWLLNSEEAKQFESVALDSISEIAETVLSAEKANVKDARLAYTEMQDQVFNQIKKFRDLPGLNVYFTCKVAQEKDQMGALLYSPSMPGTKTGQNIPYFFDEVLALRILTNKEGQPFRVLQCQPNGFWSAKDRSGKLDLYEPADMSAIIKKIQTKTATPPTTENKKTEKKEGNK